VIDPTTSAFEVLAAVDNADQRLRSGMQGRLNL
jgi:hypothetical protein